MPEPSAAEEPSDSGIIQAILWQILEFKKPDSQNFGKPVAQLPTWQCEWLFAFCAFVKHEVRVYECGCLCGSQHPVSWLESVLADLSSMSDPMMFSRMPCTTTGVIGTDVACYIFERYVTRSWTRLYDHFHARHASFEVLRST